MKKLLENSSVNERIYKFVIVTGFIDGLKTWQEVPKQ